MTTQEIIELNDQCEEVFKTSLILTLFNNEIDWKAVDMPPNVIMTAERIVAYIIENVWEIEVQPFVISIIPNMMLWNSHGKKPRKIDTNSMIIKKNIIIAPTDKMLLQEFSIISPKDKASFVRIVVLLRLSFVFKFRYIRPFINALAMCDIKMMYPAVGFASIPTPTAPTINIGPEFEQKLDTLYASACVILFCSYKSAISFEPTG